MMYKDVGDFHRKFGLPAYPQAKVDCLNKAVFLFRAKFLLEELSEFFRACGYPVQAMTLCNIADLMSEGMCEKLGEEDLEKAADALVDLAYVTLGTAHMMGLPFDNLWEEVQRANMAKERSKGNDDNRSKRGSALDVVKPEGWTPPNLNPILDHWKSFQSRPWEERLLYMSNDMLRAEKDHWENAVANAAGFASANEAAKLLAKVCRESERRGLNFVNKYPRIKG